MQTTTFFDILKNLLHKLTIFLQYLANKIQFIVSDKN